jgi:ABC-type uncharacterized transport system YnjBCD permease subunit
MHPFYPSFHPAQQQLEQLLQELIKQTHITYLLAAAWLYASAKDLTRIGAPIFNTRKNDERKFGMDSYVVFNSDKLNG